MKCYQLVALALASHAVADSILDWYDPKASVDGLFCVDENAQYLECNEYGTRFANTMADMIMGTCKEASCSGSFTYYDFAVTVDAVFPPEAKGEFDSQVHAIMGKMHQTNPQALGNNAATLTQIIFPSKMILNRVSDDTEKGNMELTIMKDGDDGVCEVLKIIEAAGGTLPEVGGFFGLIGIADC